MIYGILIGRQCDIIFVALSFYLFLQSVKSNRMKLYTPFSKPFYVMAKPAGASCNLSCAYCYYLEKRKMYDAVGGNLYMSDELLERFVKLYIESQTMPAVLFTWHGGEPLMRDLSFYRKAIELQHRYAGGRIVDNCIQTNGTMLNDEWCRFFKDNNWLVGISIDGPEDLHDYYRKSYSGRSSFRGVMRGIELLNRYGVEWNAMATVNNYNAEYPHEFYQFFKNIGCRYIQFTPVVERLLNHSGRESLASLMDTDTDIKLAPFSVSSEQWGNFICEIFDEWVHNDVASYFVQLFDATLANWVGECPGVCSLSSSCGNVLAMEYNGDVFSCDHFVFGRYRLGNIMSDTFVGMMSDEKQQLFGDLKQSFLPSECRRCEFLFACNGECPRNRFLFTDSGESGLNYLCKGYRRFFLHVAPYMDL